MVNLDLKEKRELGLLVFLLLVTLLLVTSGNLTGFAIAGVIDTNSIQLQWQDGSTATLLYDNVSQTYGDSSLVNNNMYVGICSSTPAADLNNKYIKLVYRMQTNEIDLTVLPAQITSYNATGCAAVDVDISSFAAYYPGVVTLVMDSSPTFPSPTYYPMTNTTGLLQGNYTVQYNTVGGNIEINVTEILDDQGRPITTQLPMMILGVKNSTGQLIYTNITSPGTLISIPDPGGNISFTINSYDVPNAQNLATPEICDNNIDDDFDGLIDCADPECVNDPACLPVPITPSTGGGGGRSVCQPNWNCTEWSPCRPDGLQTRECNDLNDCLNKTIIIRTRLISQQEPQQIRSCEYIPNCDNQFQDQDETDIDCGGDICQGCQIGQRCLEDDDCQSYNCIRGYCRPESVQCYEDIDCPIGFECEEFKCLFLKVFERPDKLRPYEKYLLFGLLALVLTLSSYVYYEKYRKSPYFKQLKKEKAQEKIKEEKREKQKEIQEKKEKTRQETQEKKEIAKQKAQEKREEKKEITQYSKTLGNFIKQAVKQGYSKEKIRKLLLSKKWPENIVDQYLNKLYTELPKAKVVPAKQKITYQKEIQHLEKELKRLK